MLDLFFDYHADMRSPLARRSTMAALHLLGAFTWLYFLGWSMLPLNFGDWSDINVPRMMFVSNAIASGELPLHMQDTHSLHGVTDRFFCLPDVITTPQMLLLPIVGIQAFVVVDVLLHYCLGVSALLVLRRRFQWSLFAYAVVFVLFVFNGHILSHYSVGHFTWASYFLFPAIAALCFELIDGPVDWRWVARFAGVMFYMVLAGGQHHFTWVLMFMACLIPFCWGRAGWIVAACAASGLLSAVRLLPPVLALGEFGRAGWMSDVIGYPSLLHLVSSMTELRRENLDAVDWPLLGNFVFFEVNYFEYNYYVGLLGALVVFYFGLYSWLRERQLAYPQLVVPTFAMIAMSIGTVFRIVRATGLPLIMSERLVSRMVSLPITFLIIMSGVMLQRFLLRGNLSIWNRLTGLMLFGLVAVDLSAGVRLMRVAETAKSMKPIPIEASMGELAHRDDPVYERTLALGFAMTLATAATLLALSLRERRTAVVMQ